MFISGLTPTQYLDYCSIGKTVPELVLLFFKKLHFLITQHEWLTDNKLNEKFLTGIKQLSEAEKQDPVITQIDHLFKQHHKPSLSPVFPAECWKPYHFKNIDELDRFLSDYKRYIPHDEANNLRAGFINYLNRIDRKEYTLLHPVTLFRAERSIGISAFIQSTIETLIQNITSGKDEKDMAHSLRDVRTYLTHRIPRFKDNDSGFYDALDILDFLGPLFFNTSREDLVSYSSHAAHKIDHNKLILTYELEHYDLEDKLVSKDVKEWFGAAFIQFVNGNHYIIYICSDKGYVKLDQMSALEIITPIEMFRRFQNNSAKHVCIKLPINNSQTLPKAYNWSSPKWEHNNCFLAVSILYLATLQHYGKITYPI